MANHVSITMIAIQMRKTASEVQCDRTALDGMPIRVLAPVMRLLAQFGQTSFAPRISLSQNGHLFIMTIGKGEQRRPMLYRNTSAAALDPKAETMVEQAGRDCGASPGDQVCIFERRRSSS